MESSAQESSQRDTPRELDLFGEEALEEILDSYDSLRAQIEQLQLHCEKLVTDKATVDQLLIDKEKENQLVKEKLQEEINNLRKLNIQLLSSQNTTEKGKRNIFSRKILSFINLSNEYLCLVWSFKQCRIAKKILELFWTKYTK